MRKMKFILVLIGSLLVSAYTVIQYGFYEPSLAGLVQVKLMSPNFHVTPWIYFLYVHIVTGCLALLIGPIQIFRSQKNENTRKLHQMLGKIYVISIVISSIVNLYLSFFATGGLLTSTAFFALDLIWLYTTCVAVVAIRKGDTVTHRKWMLRSYALTFAAVTLRIYLYPLLKLTGQFEVAYCLSAWLSWTINLLLIEWVIRKSRKTMDISPDPNKELQNREKII